jgi:hypothetical protein
MGNKASWIISSAAISLGGLIAQHLMTDTPAVNNPSQTDTTLSAFSELQTARLVAAPANNTDPSTSVQAYVDQEQRQSPLDRRAR